MNSQKSITTHCWWIILYKFHQWRWIDCHRVSTNLCMLYCTCRCRWNYSLQQYVHCFVLFLITSFEVCLGSERFNNNITTTLNIGNSQHKTQPVLLVRLIVSRVTALTLCSLIGEQFWNRSCLCVCQYNGERVHSHKNHYRLFKLSWVR